MIAAIERMASAARARLGALDGWRRAFAAFALGALGTAALPPFHVVPLFAVALVGFLWMLDGAARRWSGFWTGWWFGFGYFVAGLYWFAHALLTDAEKFAWLIPFAVSVIPATAAIYFGLVAVAAKRLGGPGWRGIVVFAALWTLAEWLRGLLLSGFPWNLAGYVWAGSDAMNQLAAATGILGLSFLTVATLAAPAVLGGARPSWRFLGVAAAALVLVWVGGTLRLPKDAVAAVPGIALRIVQPNIAQHHKWADALRDAHLRKHVDLTLAPGWEKLTHVIWPEAAIPYFLDEEPGLRAALGRTVPPGGLLLTGAPRITPGRVPPIRLWNSIEALAPDGTVVAVYDKFHLVPFGEYLPFRALLAPLGLTKLAHGMVDFSSGPGPATLDLPGLPPVSPLVCYEAIFPGAVVGGATSGRTPAWFLVVTNDAWFGASTGPYQHFAMTRLRAVEHGLPLIRAANTGISAFVDPYGRVVSALGLGEGGVLDGPLPEALGGGTLFGRTGSALVFLLSVAAVLMLAEFRKS